MATCVADHEETESESRLCDSCKRDNESTPASSWCRECKDVLCDQCTVDHRRIRLTAKHQTVSLNDLTEEELTVVRLQIDTNCPSHLDQPLSMYCKVHDELCCVVCACCFHNECKTLIPIDHVTEGCTDKQTLDQWSNEFTDLQNIIQTFVEEKQAVLVSLDNEKDSGLAEITCLVSKVQEKIQRFYSEISSKMLEKHQRLKEDQQKALSMLLEFEDTVVKYASLTRTLPLVTPKEALIKMNTMKNETSKGYTKIVEMLRNSPNSSLRVCNDSTTKTILDDMTKIADIDEETQSMSSLANLKTIEGIIRPLRVGLRLATQAQVLVSNPEDLMLADIRLVESWTWKSLDINQLPWFTDGTYVDDKTLLFADYYNKRLVWLNLQSKMKREVYVDGKPSCVALGNDKKDIYVVCNTNSVIRYSNSGLESGKTLVDQIGGDCIWGLAVTCDFIIMGLTESVEICTILGKKHQRIQTGGGNNYIALSENLQNFCHRDLNSVVRRNMKCDEICRYSSSNLEDLRGIRYDRYGNVYAVGMKSRNVHQISADGMKQRILIEKMSEIDQPYAIVFHPTRDLFVVTSFHEEVAFEMYEFVSVK